jgi:transcriptional regulator with PAS, ATPase and Fis domain
MERQLIEASLLRHKNKQQAADELGIGIATLYRKVKKYGLQVT